MHVGSQGVAIEQIVTAARALVDLAKLIGLEQIRWIDLGGGLSIDYHSDALPRFGEYARLMRESVPELFDTTFTKVYTEFGRSIVGKAGDSFTLVESVKYTVQEEEERRGEGWRLPPARAREVRNGRQLSQFPACRRRHCARHRR